MSVDLKESIRKFGQLYPILKSNFGIIDGFHRDIAGASEVKSIDVKSRYEHYALRLTANIKAKTDEQDREDKRKCVDEMRKELLQQGYTETEAMKKIAEDIGVNEVTVYRWLTGNPQREWYRDFSGKICTVQKTGEIPSFQKRSQNLGDVSVGVDSPQQQLPSHKKGDMLSEERRKTYVALIQQYPEYIYILREILRNEKPLLRSKDDVDRFYHLVTRKKLDPLTAYVETYYIYDGPTGLGWRFSIPYWIKVGLEAVIKKQNISLDEEQLAIQVLGDYIVKEGIKQQDIYETIKNRLRKEWTPPAPA